jgi:hypothetical protein
VISFLKETQTYGIFYFSSSLIMTSTRMVSAASESAKRISLLKMEKRMPTTTIAIITSANVGKLLTNVIISLITNIF